MKPILLTTFSVVDVIKTFSNSGNKTHGQTGMPFLSIFPLFSGTENSHWGLDNA